MNSTDIVDSDTWLIKRLALLRKEKELTRLRDKLSQERRNLPCVQIVKPYRFTDSNGEYVLSDLFGENSQLIVYHFMYGKHWEEPCKSCSFWADNFNGIDIHLAHRDITFMAISSAPIERIDDFKRRMGWSFRWLSSGGSDFNQDFQAASTPEHVGKNETYYNYKTQPSLGDEMAGVSVFVKKNNKVLHSYLEFPRFCGHLKMSDNAPRGASWQNVRLVENVELSMMNTNNRYWS